MTQDFGWIGDFAFYYEIVIFIIFNYILYLQYKYKKIKPTELKNQVFKIFIGYSIAIFFSAISKFFNSYYGGVPEFLYNSPYLGLVGRLHGARFSFIGVIIGTIYAYEVYLMVFKKEIPEKSRKIVIYSGLAICFFLGTVYSFNTETGKANQIIEIIAFALLLGFAMIVYLPFIIQAFKLVKRLQGVEREESYRRGVLSLGRACSSIVLIFTCLILDRILLVVWSISYSIFYFMAWAFAILAIWMAYSGFIKPVKQEKQEKN